MNCNKPGLLPCLLDAYCKEATCCDIAVDLPDATYNFTLNKLK